MAVQSPVCGVNSGTQQLQTENTVGAIMLCICMLAKGQLKFAVEHRLSATCIVHAELSKAGQTCGQRGPGGT